MLSERVKRNGNSFWVLRESGTSRELFYGLFQLEKNPEQEIHMLPMQYWDGARAFEVKLDIKMETCVRIIEKENGSTVEKYEFYYDPYETGRELRLSKERAKKEYGENAYLLTIEWIGCRAEPISSRYIYLENSDGEKFYFLRDTIEAMNPDGKRLMDQYITRLPEGESIEDYRLVAAPLVQQKYIVTEEH